MKRAKRKIMFIFGTRPEAIKIAPIYHKFMEYQDIFEVKLCFSGQHKEMVSEIIEFFDLRCDFNLKIMKRNQSLENLTANLMLKISSILETEKPDLVLVQGDTTTAFVGALAAFYKKVKVAHIEAGLRTYDKYSPFPEELNRELISRIADLHFAPTQKSKENLVKEGIDRKKIFVVGNSVIDALFYTLKKIEKEKILNCPYQVSEKRKFILITSHRRENIGEALLNICSAIKELAEKYKDIDFVFPVHLNPNIRNTVKRLLNKIKNVYLLKPLNYTQFVYLMSKCYLILTDSGGIQEEAPSLYKPVLVLRDKTERIEGLEAGSSILVGTNKDNIVKNVSFFIENPQEYKKFAKIHNPYGDGKTAERIVRIIRDVL